MCQRLQILVEEKGGVVKEVGERIAKASRAFGILKKKNSNLYYETNRHLQSCCFGDPLVWVRNLDHKAFQCEEGRGFSTIECMRTIMGISPATTPFHCDTCLRSFKCPQDIAQHRCVTTRPRGQVMMRPPT